MKKLFASFISVVFLLSLFAGNDFNSEKPQVNPFSSQSATRDEEIHYQEDFEDGLGDWTHYDGTLPSSMWHLDDFMTPDGTGLAWWMGDPDIGGYINHLYVVLDSPEITVPAGGHLTFDLTWHVEDAGGEDPPYNGWDGCNVRISTDGGTTWDVINGDPEYTHTSLYSFGFEHGEGANIPGWTNDNGWVEADFDLSSYAGQDVMIRWAFASDPAYCTTDEPEMFGMVIDNISLGDFVHDFNDGNEQGMTYTSIVPVGGDIWYLGEPGDAPSPTHAMICSNAQGTYNINMLNYLESPAIPLPEVADDIRADFMIKGSFLDNDTFPEVDFFGWEISVDGGTTWYYMSNPYGGSDPNYVYSDAPDIWSSMVESYSLTGNIKEYVGLDAIFRIYFQSDEDAPQGSGIMIDDFTVYTTSYIPPGPTDLAAVADNMDQSVHLTWEPPQVGGEEGWIGWDNGEYSGSLGLTTAGEWDVASKHPVAVIMPYVGGSITTIKFWPAEATADYTIRIWTGNNAENLEAEIPISAPVMDQWNEIELTTPFVIPEGETLWFGYHINQTADGTFPAGYDSGPSVNGLWANLGSWQDISGDFPYNWLLQAYVTAPDGSTYVIDDNERDRDITGYNIYRSDMSGEPYDLIDTIDPASEYTDMEPMVGAFNYYIVTALWEGVNSAPSNEAFDYVVSDDEEEFCHDDGTSESGYNVGVTKSMAVKYSPDYSRASWKLTHARIYIHELLSGQVIIRAWDDDGTSGMPGTMLFQFVYPPTNLTLGWNTIEIPEANQPTFTSGSFYLGIFEMASLSPIGLDESGSGYSYTDASGSWEMVNGNVMIRAISYYNSAAGEELVPESSYSISNYPNPFNPSTEISLNMPKAGIASLKIYNLKGQLVKTLVNDHLDTGKTSYTWNGNDDNGKKVTSGLYFYKLETANTTITKKMIMMK